MARLYEVCRSKDKIWKSFPNGTHNDTVAEPEYFMHFEMFLTNYVMKRSKSPKKASE